MLNNKLNLTARSTFDNFENTAPVYMYIYILKNYEEINSFSRIIIIKIAFSDEIKKLVDCSAFVVYVKLKESLNLLFY